MNARLSYREAAVRGASPVRLVILLYEQILEDVRNALAAQKEGDIEGRTRAINHAILVVGHLQTSLDREQGGKVAVQLDEFYNVLRAALVEAHCRQSTSALEKQISLLMGLRDAWCEVECARAESAAPSLEPATAAQQPEQQLQLSAEWNA